MDKKTLKQMRDYLEANLKGFEDEFNVKVEVGNIKYGDTYANISLKASVVSEDGEIQSAETQALKEVARLYDWDMEALLKPFQHGGETFTIYGYSHRAKRYPMLAKSSKGQSYKFTRVDILTWLGIGTSEFKHLLSGND